LGILSEYNIQDLALTRDCYLKQLFALDSDPNLLRLIRLDCVDLLILEEMEWNGIILDVDECNKRAEDLRWKLAEMDLQLDKLVDGFSINWNSDDQRSVVFYGGQITRTKKEPDGVFKTGKKAGQVKYKSVEVVTEFPRLIEPLPKTELAKDGYWSTSEPTLLTLRPRGRAKEIIRILLERLKIERLVSGYYEGLPNQIATMAWTGNTIHGTLNQCVAATGRLSSSKPNLQNNPHEVDKLFRSRYD
jgi:DNA polymerase-1